MNSSLNLSRSVLSLFWCLYGLIMLPMALADEPKPTGAPGQKYFFPYAACVLFTIKKCQEEPTADNKGTYTVQIDRVFRGPFEKGQEKTFSFDYYPELFPKKPLSEMAQQRCVLAFNPSCVGPLCFLDDPYTPFPFQRFTENQLDQLQKRIDEVKMEPAQLQGLLQSYIQRTWTPERVRDFCRPELRQFSNGSTPAPFTKQMGAELNYHLSPDFGTASWHAGIDNDGIIDYFVDVKRGKDVWSVAEAAHPVLTSCTDDDYLTYRVRRTLDACFESYRFTHPPTEPHSPIDQKSLHVVRDSAKKATAVECKQKGGHVLTAQLDAGLSVKSILVDGHSDQVWNAALHEVNTDIDKMNSGAADRIDVDTLGPIAKTFLFYWRMLIVLWVITIAMLVVASVLGVRLLRRLKKAGGPRYARKPWIIAACLVPPVFILLQQAIISFVFRSASPMSQQAFWSLISISLIIGIVPFMIALLLIGATQALWKDPTFAKFSKAWFIKRLMPLWLLLFAAWITLLAASSLKMML